jgi:hypothetical protein
VFAQLPSHLLSSTSPAATTFSFVFLFRFAIYRHDIAARKNRLASGTNAFLRRPVSARYPIKPK